MEECEKFLANNLTSDNVMNLIQFANANDCFLLVRSCIKFIVENIIGNERNYINTLDTFLQTHSNILHEILNTLFKYASIEPRRIIL